MAQTTETFMTYTAPMAAMAATAPTETPAVGGDNDGSSDSDGDNDESLTFSQHARRP